MLVFISLVTIVINTIALATLAYFLYQNTDVLKAIHDSVKHHDDKHEQFNIEQAEKWFEKGEIKALKQYCEQFIKEKPNSVQANWYCGLSHYNQGDYILAKKYFENVIRINPLWRDGAIVYLQEIAERVGLTGSTTLH